MPENLPPLPDFTRWPSFPFEGDLRVKKLAPPVQVEPARGGEDAADCIACQTPDEAYIWVSERWRVRAMDRPTGLPAVLVLECRSHLDLGDLPNLLAAELGVMTVRLERAVRSLDGVARVHVNRWGDGAAHLHMWFLARPYGRLQLRGTFLTLWDDILPVIPESQWLENLGLVAAWLAEFGGRAIAEPPHIAWQSPGTMEEHHPAEADGEPGTGNETRHDAEQPEAAGDHDAPSSGEPAASDGAVTRDLSAPARAEDDAGPTRNLAASARKLSLHPGEQTTQRLAPAPPIRTGDDQVSSGRQATDDPAELDTTVVRSGAQDTAILPGSAAAPQNAAQETVVMTGPDQDTAELKPTAQGAAKQPPMPPEPAERNSSGQETVVLNRGEQTVEQKAVEQERTDG